MYVSVWCVYIVDDFDLQRTRWPFWIYLCIERVKLKLKKLKLAAFLNKLMKIVKSDTDINNACKA